VRVADTPCCLNLMAIAGLGFVAWTTCSNDQTSEAQCSALIERESLVSLLNVVPVA